MKEVNRDVSRPAQYTVIVHSQAIRQYCQIEFGVKDYATDLRLERQDTVFAIFIAEFPTSH